MITNTKYYLLEISTSWNRFFSAIWENEMFFSFLVFILVTGIIILVINFLEKKYNDKVEYRTKIRLGKRDPLNKDHGSYYDPPEREISPKLKRLLDYYR